MTDGATGPIRVRVPSELEPLIPAYIQRRHEDVARIREALAAGDLKTVQSIGHSIKGSGAGYGFDGLSALAREIEFAAKDGDAAQAARSLAAVADYLKRVRIEFGD